MAVRNIQIIYAGTTYGPIRPAPLSTIFAALQISPRSSPTVAGISDPTKAYSAATDPHAIVSPGLYALHCKPDVKWDSTIDRWPSPPPTKPKFMPEEAVVDLPALPKRQRPKKEPQDEDEIEAGIQAMLHLVGTIPARYVKHNARLSTRLSTAIYEINTLQDLLADQDQSPASRRAIQYRLLAALHDVWNTVWARFAPATRSYHISDVTNPANFARAEHVLNTFHVWRRTLDATTWQQMQRSSTLRHLVDVSKLSRYHRIAPKILDIDQPGTGAPWMYLARPTKHASPPPSSPLYDVCEQVRTVRSAFIDVMLRTGMHRDSEMDSSLRELVNSRAAAADASATGDMAGQAYPVEAVVRALRKEFSIRLAQ
ncbi:hypothetical protein HDU87_002620 [Geranomyces variabilis]|uniref:Uncharacterized protein n=1 Tax=Geranomyces variabilis TaxID=109894 RepID=A0AAD5TRW7_9FUNG|nr:hypothetical protein HDU87_002620 [Geranomyces variabilis]